MKRPLTVLLALAGAIALGAQQPSIERERLEMIRKMSPEERARLRERLEQLKKLPVEERERLTENLTKIKAMPAEEVKKLREKATHLTPEDHRDYTELAAGFFRWAHRRGYQEGFPRGIFFTWLKKERPGKIQEIRAIEPGVGSARVDEFIRLYYEFSDVMLARTEQHVTRHKCVPYESFHELRDASPKEFWPKWQEVTRACQARKSNPGPVPPRPVEPQKK